MIAIFDFFAVTLAASVILPLAIFAALRARGPIDARRAHIGWRMVILAMLALPPLFVLAPKIDIGTSPSLLFIESEAVPVAFLARDPAGLALVLVLLLAVYAGVAFLFLCRLFAGHVLAAFVVSHARPFLRSNVSERIFWSRRVSAPVTFGFVRPAVILPAQARHWPAAQIASAVAHEEAHIQRRDYLWTFVAAFAQAIYWGNPFLWIARRRMETHAERCADAIAVDRVGDPRTYARHLISIARDVTDRGWLVSMSGVGMAGRTGTMKQRIDEVLRASTTAQRKGRTEYIALIVAFIVLTGATATSAEPSSSFDFRVATMRGSSALEVRDAARARFRYYIRDIPRNRIRAAIGSLTAFSD